MSSDLMKAGEDLRNSLVYKLRLNKLSSTSRNLQKAGVINTQGFLTIEGAQVYLDYLWQKDKDAQKAIAAEVAKLKDGKDEDK